MGAWSDLPGDLLRKIEENINIYYDKIRFRCVCTHWQSSSPPELPDLRQQQSPWLLLPYKGSSSCGLYLPFEDKVYDIDLPEAGERNFIGSGHGWVVTLQENGSINIVNPLSRVRVPLPPISVFPRPIDNLHVWKISLSCSPASNDFRAVAFYGEQLAYCKLGDDKWCRLVNLNNRVPRSYTGTFVGPRNLNFPCRYTDATFYHGKFYTLTTQYELMVCDDIVSSPNLRECPISPDKSIHKCFNLVNSCHGLMAVARILLQHVGGVQVTYGFEAFKLDTSNERWRWIPMENLDADEILFMGRGTQLGLSSQDFRGSEANRIYFVHERCRDIEHCFDNGVFTFEDKRLHPFGYECNSRMIWPNPIWFTPNPFL